MKALLAILFLILVSCGDDEAVSEGSVQDGGGVGNQKSEGNSKAGESCRATGNHKGDCRTKPVEPDDDDEKDDDYDE